MPNVKTTLGQLTISSAREFGNVQNVTYTVSGKYNKYTATLENGETIEVSLNLEYTDWNDPDTEPVTSYYINYASRWASADYANVLSFMLVAMARIAYDLEKIGITYKS